MFKGLCYGNFAVLGSNICELGICINMVRFALLVSETLKCCVLSHKNLVHCISCFLGCCQKLLKKLLKTEFSLFDQRCL